MSALIMASKQAHTVVPPSVELESVTCPLDCSPNDKVVVSGSDLLHGLPGEFTVLRCVTCGLKRTSPRPTPETIGLYYPADYGPYLGTQVVNGGVATSGLKASVIKFGKRLFDTKATALPDLKPGHMLEIGCASGSYLHHMAQRGWQVEGIEFSPTAAQSAQALGYKVDIGALEMVEKPVNSYDLIVGWMVLEHLHQPVQSLRKLAQWARPDAVLVVSIPNIGSKSVSLFGRLWHDYHLPNHLFHYDALSIGKLMQAGGWEVLKIHHHRTISNLIASVGYWLHEHGFTRLGQKFINFPERGGRLGALLTYPLALPLAWLGQTGRMTVWAKRAC
jgi:2-polyprenyl-3-methyl-5-hydroxy-6-metoxy-1,4-benzoquinol methylase